MIAEDIRKRDKIRHNGFAHYVLEVRPPNPAKKDGTPKMCRFLLTTGLGHHGTTIEVEMPWDQKV